MWNGLTFLFQNTSNRPNALAYDFFFVTMVIPIVTVVMSTNDRNRQYMSGSSLCQALLQELSCIFPFGLPNYPSEQGAVIIPFYRQDKWGHREVKVTMSSWQSLSSYPGNLIPELAFLTF